MGVTHGLEPDHAAGILALTDDSDGWLHAAFVGGTFASGHVLVVLVWVGVLSLLGRGADAAPAAFDALGSVVPGLVPAAPASCSPGGVSGGSAGRKAGRSSPPTAGRRAAGS